MDKSIDKEDKVPHHISTLSEEEEEELRKKMKEINHEIIEIYARVSERMTMIDELLDGEERVWKEKEEEERKQKMEEVRKQSDEIAKLVKGGMKDGVRGRIWKLVEGEMKEQELKAQKKFLETDITITKMWAKVKSEAREVIEQERKETMKRIDKDSMPWEVRKMIDQETSEMSKHIVGDLKKLINQDFKAKMLDKEVKEEVRKEEEAKIWEEVKKGLRELIVSKKREQAMEWDQELVKKAISLWVKNRMEERREKGINDDELAMKELTKQGMADHWLWDMPSKDMAELDRKTSQMLKRIEREFRRVMIMERPRQIRDQLEKSDSLEKKKYDEEKTREAQSNQEKMANLLNRLIVPVILQTQLSYLQLHSQTVVDFLNRVLQDPNPGTLLPSERKRALYLLCKIAKSAQVYPKTIQLRGVECDFNRSINEGGFGVIYKGMYQGQTVCVKAVRIDQMGIREKALRAHAGELVLGTHVLHPNILPLYGAFVSNEGAPRICITSPWMEHGTLIGYLYNHPDTSRVLLVSDILSGLQYLHEMAVVHADLKGSNVLISRTQRAMLADFGISRIAMTNVGTTTAADASGTIYWMAPELLTADDIPPATHESDIWAFGCVCYEILTGKIPFQEYKPILLIGAFYRGKVISLKPVPMPNLSFADEIWSLAEKCLCYNPSERTTADDALKFVLDLNVKDERPPPEAFADLNTSVGGSVEIDYDALASIIQQTPQNN